MLRLNGNKNSRNFQFMPCNANWFILISCDLCLCVYINCTPHQHCLLSVQVVFMQIAKYKPVHYPIQTQLPVFSPMKIYNSLILAIIWLTTSLLQSYSLEQNNHPMVSRIMLSAPLFCPPGHRLDKNKRCRLLQW